MSSAEVIMLEVTEADRTVLKELNQQVWDAGLTELDITSMLGIRDVPLIKPQEMPSYLWNASIDNSLRALAVALFLLGQRVRRTQAGQLLGTRALELLLRHGLLLENEPGIVSSAQDLYPCLGAYVFTDPLLARRYLPDHVYQLGTDSYALARVTPRRRANWSLDLCTGSGIHAILAAFHSHHVVGVDINPRALAFSRFNAELNGVAERCTFLQGDLYEPVGDRTFDLITANPPFVPTPDKDMPRHRTGGESGEEVSERLVAGLPRYLNEGGTFSMVLDFPVREDSTYLQRLQTWLSGSGPYTQGVPGWGIAVLNFGHVPREHYIREHVGEHEDFAEYRRQFMEYLRLYDRYRIVEIGFGNVFIRRLPEGRPGWAVERMMITPHTDQSKRVAAWLDALTTFRDPDWAPDWDGWKPQWGPLVAEVWRDSRKRKGFVEFTDVQWSAPLPLTADQAELASQLKGRQTAGQLARTWATRKKLSPEQGRERVTELLRLLGQNLVCV